MKDFFISYNSADRQWAEWIAWQLEEAGYTTVLQAWDFRPGSNFVLEMQRAAGEAERTIAVLSPDYLDAFYTQPEWAAAFGQDPMGKRGTLLPVRVRECDLEGLLPPIIHIDLVGLEEAAAKDALLAGVRRERAKPAVPPGFPGAVPRSVPERPRFPGVPPMRESSLDGSSGYVKAAIIAGIFAVIAACVFGGSLIINTLLEKGVAIISQSPTPTLTMAVAASTSTATPISPTNTPVSPTDTPKPEPPTSTLTSTPVPINATVQVEALNLRAGPGKEYAIIGRLTQGDVATVIGQNPGGDWLKVEHKSKTGWVAREYVEVPEEVAMVPVTEVSPVETPTDTPGPVATPTSRTNTPVPPTDTPKPEPPTNTPIPEPTDTPTPKPTDTLIATPPPASPTPTPVSITWGSVTWLNNPELSAPRGLPGDRGCITEDSYPEEDWVNGISFSITDEQILIVHGSKARLPDDVPDAGIIGRPNNCFLLMTRGPFSSTIDLFEAKLEIHDADSNADTLVWAAQKAHDMRAMYTETCAQGMDIWVGRR
jgi:uncharacterized protein YraI